MSFLKFWKPKEESPEPQLPPEPNEPLGMGMNAAMAGLPHENPAFAPQAFEQRTAFGQPSAAQGPSVEQQMQLLSAKMDTIKAQLETVLQRLDSMSRKEEKPEPTLYQQRWRNV
ncbi:hypothetical protein J4211_05400 [Candidatus Woesearchaeota archaeon]|nr:hypothetical protein [Candidatus Woesearchaeota archaeon]